MATRDIGLLIIELGGGRRQASDAVDARVGFSGFVQIGQRVQAGDPIAQVHAADANDAERARQSLSRLIALTEHEPPASTSPLITRLPG